MRHPIVAVLASSVLALSVLSALRTSAAPDSSALINEALDQPVDLKLNTVLPKAMSTIADQTGVKVVADPSVWDVLPWGEQTNIQVNLTNQTLRNGLEAVAGRLGLVLVTKAQAVELQPMPALRRLGRRATEKELEALFHLGSTPLNEGAGAKDTKLTVAQLVDVVDARLAATKPEFAIEFRRRDLIPAEQSVFVARNATIAAALEALSRETSATWYPWGKSIVVLPREMQVRTIQLGKTLDVRFTDTDISQVLLELEQASGVEFEIEAGAVQRVPPESRKVSLILTNATVQQALEAISGITGLDYVVKGAGLYIWNQSAGVGAGGGSADPAVGMIQLDNGMQVMVRRSHLPPDVREYVDHRMQRAINGLREMMKEEGFKPTTQPATEPATQAAKTPAKAG